MELGKKQMLTVVKVVDFGVYLGDDREKVLLPKKQVPAGIEPGDPIEVFLYKDSSDRLIATVNEPKLTLGESAILKVAQVGKFGAFLDWGLEKDLFLPFKEQTYKVKPGDECLVGLYIDISGVILTFIPSMGLFFIADILGGNKVVLVGSLIQDQLMKAHNWPFAAALSVVLMILTSLMISLYKRVTHTTELEGIL